MEDMKDVEKLKKDVEKLKRHVVRHEKQIRLIARYIDARVQKKTQSEAMEMLKDFVGWPM